MEPSVAGFARNFSVMVRIRGPDPKALKMKGHAFHIHQSGTTTLSASGFLLPDGFMRKSPAIIDRIRSSRGYAGVMAITVATVVEPFLTNQHRNDSSGAVEFSPQLIPGACIDVLVEDTAHCGEDIPASRWFTAELFALACASKTSDALESLIGNPLYPFESTSWEFGWSLASSNDAKPSLVDRNYASQDLNKPSLIHSVTKIAFLGVSSLDLKGMMRIETLQVPTRGERLLVMGSPFGILSPMHFLNSISVGAVANFFPPKNSSHYSLLMADIRCLPGMEGAPIFDRYSALIGILTRPIRQKNGDGEIQIAIMWDAIANIEFNKSTEVQTSKEIGFDKDIRNSMLNTLDESRNDDTTLKYYPNALDHSYINNACSSIVLVIVGTDTWASGVVLSTKGLILTNAHILEPWRFKKATLFDSVGDDVLLQKRNVPPEQDHLGTETIYTSLNVKNSALFQNFGYDSFKEILIRFNNTDCEKLYSARVIYISRGPLDVALLQLESSPAELHPIIPEYVLPSPASTVHVIGHGLLGPKSKMFPSVTTGVLANIVTSREPNRLSGSLRDQFEKYLPLMLQTTAAIHPGASGGAVVNSIGRMVGLVTSNARLGGRSIIPHMNFSIPCAALRPVFEFSDEQDPSKLRVFDEADDYLSSVWALVPPAAPRPEGPFVENQKGKERGSMFDKFLSESRVGTNTEKTQIRDGRESKL